VREGSALSQSPRPRLTGASAIDTRRAETGEPGSVADEKRGPGLAGETPSPLGTLAGRHGAMLVANKRRMSYRPDVTDETLSKEALAELRRRLAMLHVSGVEQFYRDAYARCAPVAGRVPKASAIQELVTAWKLLRKWSKSNPIGQGR